MPLEKAQALVVRTADWSETSRVVTLWTREFGKVRALAKGGRRLKSNFDNALDLLTVCDIVLLRKTSGSLDLLTEARVRERFPELRKDLSALNAGYYVAELLGEGTQDYDPHVPLYDGALELLRDVGPADVSTGPRLLRFELVLLRELGYGPALDHCAACTAPLAERGMAFSAQAGGVVCPACQGKFRDRRVLAFEGWKMLRDLQTVPDAWRNLTALPLRGELRQIVNDTVTYLLGRRPRLQPYLGS